MAKQVHRFPEANRITAALRRLYRAGIRLPAFRVGEFGFALHPDTGRLFVTLGNRRLGTVLKDGLFRPTDDEFRKLDATIFEMVVSDPLTVLRMISGVLPEPRCAVCRIPLGTKKDRACGIGKKCYEKGEFWRLEKKTSAGDRRSSKLRTRRKTRRKH